MVKNLENLIDTMELSNGISIWIISGTLSENDIIIKYKDINGTQHWRQPKHIHWIVDWMLKKEHNKKAVIELVEYFAYLWRVYQPGDCKWILKTLHTGEKKLNDLYSWIDRDWKIDYFSKKLNWYGYYKVDFLIFSWFLLLLQEKNNRSDAYMFEKMFSALAQDYSILYDVISDATSNYSK